MTRVVVVVGGKVAMVDGVDPLAADTRCESLQVKSCLETLCVVLGD